jgi:Pyrimidine dimer DNA glycosylase
MAHVRLWSVHPRYLDVRGLTACWREGLLAQAVLLGKTRGYRNHPQLLRFRAQRDPVASVQMFLSAIVAEAQARGYTFDARKIVLRKPRVCMTVTRGQLAFEWEHLRAKLKKRDPARVLPARPKPHPMFKVVAGGIEAWEKV